MDGNGKGRESRGGKKGGRAFFFSFLSFFNSLIPTYVRVLRPDTKNQGGGGKAEIPSSLPA